MKIADTHAAVLAGRDWIAGNGVRGALASLPGSPTLEDVGVWAQPGLIALQAATPDPEKFAARYAGAIAAALIMGAKLKETDGQ